MEYDLGKIRYHDVGRAMDQTVRQEMLAMLPRLRRFAYGLTGSVDGGDDLVQSACERAFVTKYGALAG